MLNPNASSRPSASDIIRYIEGFRYRMGLKPTTSNLLPPVCNMDPQLLNTIALPKNLSSLSSHLPLSKYQCTPAPPTPPAPHRQSMLRSTPCSPCENYHYKHRAVPLPPIRTSSCKRRGGDKRGDKRGDRGYSAGECVQRNHVPNRERAKYVYQRPQWWG